jgi:hypothetical protein
LGDAKFVYYIFSVAVGRDSDLGKVFNEVAETRTQSHLPMAERLALRRICNIAFGLPSGSMSLFLATKSHNTSSRQLEEISDEKQVPPPHLGTMRGPIAVRYLFSTDGLRAKLGGGSRADGAGG